MQKSHVQAPAPYLAISKEYAFAHFPNETTSVTLQRPGKSKKWNPRFYKRKHRSMYMLRGQWLDFVRDNHVLKGDICVLIPMKGGRKFTFTVHLLRATATLSRGKERNDSGGPSKPPYFVPCKSRLSKYQKKIVERKVQAIQSEVPIYVAIMRKSSVGASKGLTLELGSRYATSVHLPARGQTVVLQCRKNIWEAKMVIHSSKRWYLNGGWSKFVRDNDLRIGDICLFELKKNERKLTMMVHIISREQF
uniref:TF-B3 domain-containing protein n=1 Tax=Arundo donax TaxID=35708 RepID=A0A0A8ZPI9_ARUDO